MGGFGYIQVIVFFCNKNKGCLGEKIVSSPSEFVAGEMIRVHISSDASSMGTIYRLENRKLCFRCETTFDFENHKFDTFEAEYDYSRVFCFEFFYFSCLFSFFFHYNGREEVIMIRIAIVEDDESDRERLSGFLNRYVQEKKLGSFDVNTFENPLVFLGSYSLNFDLIFLDIKMPGMTGMELARKIREKDKKVTLIFITSLGQYAIQGYEVEALDFVVKPIQYPEFVLKFSRALERIHQSNREDTIVVSYKGNNIRLSVDEITYVEALQHRIVYHVEGGEEYMSLGTLKSAQDQLSGYHFSMCNKCYLVHLSQVLNIDESYCYVPNGKLLISRPRKKEFRQSFVEYLQGKKNA